jgi:tellurite resistance protein
VRPHDAPAGLQPAAVGASDATSPGAAGAPAVPAGWLQRLPPGLFAIPLGLIGLSGSWGRLAQADAASAPFSAMVQSALLASGIGIWVLLTVLWSLKLLRHPQQVRGLWGHPLQGSFLALGPVSALLVVAVAAPLAAHTALLTTLQVLVALALALQLSIAWQVVAQLTTGRIGPELVTPALYLPTVAGGFVGAIALQALGLHGWAVLLFGTGLGAWALLEARILHRLFAGPLPLPLRPTLGLELAPTSVGALALAVLWPQLPADVLLVALGIGTGPVLAVLARWRWWTETPFSAGFWSFSFPIAAYASVIVEAVRRGGWPPLPAWTAVLLASAVIAYLAWRTLLLWRTGRLLPPA